MSSVKCSQCFQEILDGDLIIENNKTNIAVCPICFSEIILKDELSDVLGSDDQIVEKIVEEWGIDELTASEIIDSQMQKNLDRFMFITEDGVVINALGEEELKMAMLDFLMNPIEGGTIGDIKYIFVDGVCKNLEVDLKFNDIDENEIEEYRGMLGEEDWMHRT